MEITYENHRFARAARSRACSSEFKLPHTIIVEMSIFIYDYRRKYLSHSSASFFRMTSFVKPSAPVQDTIGLYRRHTQGYIIETIPVQDTIGLYRRHTGLYHRKPTHRDRIQWGPHWLRMARGRLRGLRSHCGSFRLNLFQFRVKLVAVLGLNFGVTVVLNVPRGLRGLCYAWRRLWYTRAYRAAVEHDTFSCFSNQEPFNRETLDLNSFHCQGLCQSILLYYTIIGFLVNYYSTKIAFKLPFFLANTANTAANRSSNGKKEEKKMNYFDYENDVSPKRINLIDLNTRLHHNPRQITVKRCYILEFRDIARLF